MFIITKQLKLAKNSTIPAGGWLGGWVAGWSTLGIMQTQPPTELELGLGLSLAITKASQQA